MTMTTEQLAQWAIALWNTNKSLQIKEPDVTALTDLTHRLIRNVKDWR